MEHCIVLDGWRARAVRAECRGQRKRKSWTARERGHDGNEMMVMTQTHDVCFLNERIERGAEDDEGSELSGRVLTGE